MHMLENHNIKEMKKINSEETVQEYIAKLPKENMFTRSSRRISLLPFKARIAEDCNLKTDIEENDHLKEKYSLTKPLMDLSNQRGKHNEKFKTSENDRNLNCTNVAQRSALLKEFHELRKSRISSGLSNNRLNVATPSQNNPVLLLSARKRTPFTSGRRNPGSHKKAFCNTKIESSPKVIVSKRFNLRSSCKKVSVHSSGKKGVFHRRNEIAKIQIKETIEKNVDQDCRKALWFSEDENEDAEKENTKPLPALQLSAHKTSGSKLRRSTITVRPRCTAVNSSSTRKVSQFSENNSICNESNKERRRAFTRRYSSIPSINKSRTTAKQQRRRSEMLSSIDVMKQNENGLSPISEKNTTVGSVLSAHTKQFSKRTSLIPVVDERKRTNHIPLVAERKRTSLIPLADARMNVVPQIVLSPPSNNGSDDLNIDRESHEENLLTESFTIDKKDSHTCVKCSSRVTKDSETNTIDMNEAHQIYLREVKTKMEKALLDQQRLEKEFQVITQDYFQKGKKIMEEYKSTFNFMNHFVNEFKHVLTLPVNSTQIDKKELEGVKPEPALKNCKKVCKEYRFLGTPLPKKNKKLMHSFSDPSSPTNKSPTSYEASFYSVDSVISPFTNIVGELERPSLLPMTPGSRNNFTNLKVSLNEQLDLLFQ